MEKKFKCKDEVIYRFPGNDFTWTFGIFSHYGKTENGVEYAVVDGTFYRFDDTVILPYEGNEHLVGTTDSPDEEVRLEKGEMVLAKTDNGNWVLATYKEHSELPWNNIDVVFSNGHRVSIDQMIRFSDFNPTDMEETRKHILWVKNGKIIRYKG